MPSRRLSAALGPLIALVLIGGVIAVVMDGSDDTDTDFAQAPDEPTGSPTSDPDPEATPDAEPADGAQPTPDATSSPAPESSPDGEATPEPIASEQAVPPGAGPTPMPEPVAEPTSTPAPAVQDPTALTGGWVGGTPNTGTAVSAAGLLLLALGGGLLWLRRART